MQDREIPPVEEGEADGGAAGVHLIIVAVAQPNAAIARIREAASIALPWITVTERRSATITDTNPIAGCVRDLRLPTSRPTRNPCPPMGTRTPASLPSWTICFSWPKSRRQHAR